MVLAVTQGPAIVTVGDGPDGPDGLLAVLFGLLDIYRYHQTREAAITTDPAIELKLLLQVPGQCLVSRQTKQFLFELTMTSVTFTTP
jgi:hypothetical protein